MKYTQSNMDTWWIFDPGVCVTICIQLWQFGSIWEISRGDQQHFEGINLQDPSTMSQLSHSVNRGQAPKRYHRSSHQMSSCICCCTVIFGCFECSCKWVCSFCVQTFSVKNKWEVDNIIPPHIIQERVYHPAVCSRQMLGTPAVCFHWIHGTKNASLDFCAQTFTLHMQILRCSTADAQWDDSGSTKYWRDWKLAGVLHAAWNSWWTRKTISRTSS